jgi:hypothetical protein
MISTIGNLIIGKLGTRNLNTGNFIINLDIGKFVTTNVGRFPCTQSQKYAVTERWQISEIH